MAIARSHKTETAAGRSLALSTLMNASIASGVDSATTVVVLSGDETEGDRLNDVNGIKRAVFR